jgi:hypothetical protein
MGRGRDFSGGGVRRGGVIQGKSSTKPCFYILGSVLDKVPVGMKVLAFPKI